MVHGTHYHHVACSDFWSGSVLTDLQVYLRSESRGPRSLDDARRIRGALVHVPGEERTFSKYVLHVHGHKSAM